MPLISKIYRCKALFGYCIGHPKSKNRQRKKRVLRSTPNQQIKLNFADFYCPKLKLVIEIDGSSHIGRETQDAYRDQTMRDNGYEVIRVSASDVMNDIDSVLKHIAERISPPKRFAHPGTEKPPARGAGLSGKPSPAENAVSAANSSEPVRRKEPGKPPCHSDVDRLTESCGVDAVRQGPRTR